MRVYKFLSAQYALKDIDERRIKLSEFRDMMNDPFELLGSRWSDSGVDGALTSHAVANYGVLCFSAPPTPPLCPDSCR